jgi:microcystin-dependent protein
MSQPYIGQIMVFAFNFAPRDWSFCNGALIPISQNQALFAIIGTTYGGNGMTNFALPNIQDTCVVGTGQGVGLSNYVLGEKLGVAEVTLNQTQLPMHNHAVDTMGADTATDYGLTVAQGYWLGKQTTGSVGFFAAAPDGTTLSPLAVSTAGGSLPHMNEQPYLGMNYCIAQYGIFPSQN